jgi:hypothetical protein
MSGGFDVCLVDVGVTLAGEFVDEIGVQVVHAQHVTTPQFVEGMRENIGKE